MANGYSPELLDVVRPFWEQSELSGTFDQWMKEWGMYFDDYDPYQEDVKRQQFALSKEILREFPPAGPKSPNGNTESLTILAPTMYLSKEYKISLFIASKVFSSKGRNKNFLKLQPYLGKRILSPFSVSNNCFIVALNN